MGSVEAEEAPVPVSTSVVDAGKQTIKNTTQNYSIIEQYDLNYVSEVLKLSLGDPAALDQTDHIAMRKWQNEFASKLESAPLTKRHRPEADISISEVAVEYGAGESFSLRIYSPSEASKPPRPVIIMLHGGSWIMGLSDSDNGPAMFFASELDAVVILVDYRLAPEYPFPAAHNDCYETLDWVARNAAGYNLDINRIALWGTSAGGQLAASIALRDSNEHKVPRIKHINLVVPVLCAPQLYPAPIMTESSSVYRFSSKPNDGDVTKTMRQTWEKYANDKISDPYASVLVAKIPPNHPSVHVSVAGCDGLRDEGIAYALALRNAGIDTQLEIVPGVGHGINASPKAHVAIQWYRDQVRALYIALRTDF